MKIKLIETSLPLKTINQAAVREKNIRSGHPSTLHLWWARRPLATARAIIFATLVDDPLSSPQSFPTIKEQIAERERLFRIMEDLVVWENSNDPRVLAMAKDEIKKSCGEQSMELLDPFAGGGSIPLEAQRLGLTALARDLNPVAVAINKAMVEIPPLFAGQPPINPEAAKDNTRPEGRAQGLADDVAYYAEALRKKAWDLVGRHYPTVKTGREGSEADATVLAWIWARTVKCPNPACGARAPLARSLVLTKKEKRETFVEPVAQKGRVLYEIKSGTPKIDETIGRRGAKCAICQSPINLSYVREEGLGGRLGVALMAIVAKGPDGKIYLPANEAHEKAAIVEKAAMEGDYEIASDSRRFGTAKYGLATFFGLFAARQLKFLATLSESLEGLAAEIEKDAEKAGLAQDGKSLEAGGTGAKAYSQAVIVYLSFLVDKLADYHGNLCSWDRNGETIRNVFARPALPMGWDYVEGNPFSDGSGSLKNMAEWIVKAIRSFPANGQGEAKTVDAKVGDYPPNVIISTDPPYYDYISYSNLSDYFYIWLRRSLKKTYGSVFGTIRAPKNDELLVDANRFGGSEIEAKNNYESGLRKAFANMRQSAAEEFPVTVYCPYKPASPSEGAENIESGWEFMVSALIDAGFIVNGSWPLKMEMENRINALANDSLASSLVIVGRKGPKDPKPITRRDFLAESRVKLKEAIKLARAAGVEPDDLAISAIGPGLAVYCQREKILEPDGAAMSFKSALGIVKREIAELLSE